MTAPPSQHGELVRTWLRWLEELKGQTVNIFHNRQIWREMRAALMAHEGGIFLSHYANLYVDGQVMAVRRLGEKGASGATVSLDRVLEAFGKNLTVLSRERYVALHETATDDELFRRYWIERAQEVYDDKYGDGGSELSARKNDKRRLDLEENTRTVRAFADRTVAHTDRRGLDELPTFETLDTAINEIGELVKDVELLLTAKSTDNMEPTIQYDWKHPFRSVLF